MLGILWNSVSYLAIGEASETTCTPLSPVPMIETRFPSSSMSSNHNAVWRIAPLNLFIPANGGM
jgi:hypothetical protein